MMTLNKQVKRHVTGSWLLAVATLLATTCGGRGATMTIGLPAVSGAAGAEVKVPVNVEGAKGCGALQFDLTYDAAVLEVKGVDEGELLTGAMLTDNVPSPGRLKIALITQEPLAGDGEVAVVAFTVKAAGKSALEIENAKAWEHASNLDMRVLTMPGQFAAAGGAMGIWPVAGGVGAIVVVVAIVAMKKRGRA